ncbi:transposase [Paraburkholderia sp. DD10]|uniref:transposase n=1 Tax=Paraburkholderia sp. DD10 TaxID=3409691 RepID=UPI003BA3B780
MGKYSEETKLAVVKDYCSGTAGLKVVARRHDVDVTSLRKWVAGYRSHGAAGVREKARATYRSRPDSDRHVGLLYQRWDG